MSDADAQQFYTKYHTQHISDRQQNPLGCSGESAGGEIIAKAKAPGADFAALAKQYSDDPAQRTKAATTGLLTNPPSTCPEFKQAAFSLKPGEITPDPVASPQYGYFIIKLDAVKSSLPADYAKNKAKYIDAIRQQKAQDKYQALMTGLKAAAKIDVKDPALAGDRALAEAAQQGNPGAVSAEAAGRTGRLPAGIEGEPARAAKKRP